MALKAIFYARFHPSRGPCVMEQYPPGSVSTRAAPASEETAFVEFAEVSGLVIPPYDVCGRGLSVCVEGVREGKRRERLRVRGWPVSLESEVYARNRFTFNVCFVTDEGAGPGGSEGEDGETGRAGWDKVVEKTARFFTALEVEDGILSTGEDKKDHGDGPARTVFNLLEKVYTQLNTYNETSIPMPRTPHVLNLRLTRCHSTLLHPPASHNKVKISAHHIPLLTFPLPSPADWTPDLVLTRILPHITGTTHIRRIAERSETDIKLVKRAIRGLVECERARVLDCFHFGAGYALTADWSLFVKDAGEGGEVVEEGRRYICVEGGGRKGREVTGKELLGLYAALTSPPGQSVRDFVLANQTRLQGVDVRRLVTFGVLKGFLRRVHKYALAVAPPASASRQSGSGKLSGSSGGKGGSSGDKAAEREFERAWRKAALSSGWATPPFEVASSFDGRDGSVGKVSPDKKGPVVAEGGEEAEAEDETLRGMLDGKHCLDEVCVVMRMSEPKLMERLRSKRFEEVVIFSK